MREIIKNILIRVVVLGTIFAATVFVLSRHINQTESVVTSDMAAAQLPVVYVELAGQVVNEMHGYVDRVQINYLRDTLTPLPTDRILPLKIAAYGADLESIGYEIISTDGEEVVESAGAVSFYTEGDYTAANLTIQNNMIFGQEYLLRIILQISGREVSYYTRIVEQDSLYTGNYLSFVNNFIELCLDKSQVDEVAAYIDTSYLGDNSTLAKVTIESEPEQLVWKDMDVELNGDIHLQIKENNSVTASVIATYMVTSVDTSEEGSGRREIYMVREFYRLRNDDSRVLLLNFEREVEELFQNNNYELADAGFNLGITGMDFEYESNDSGTVVSFVQNRNLWSYHTDSGKLYQVFSFLEDETDARQRFGQHDIDIISVDDDGSVAFMVYGYMNRGEHEGRTGVAVYSFNANTNSVEEMVFISTDRPYAILEKDMGNMAYINKSNVAYLMLAGTVYQIDLETRDTKTLAENLKADCFVTEQDGSHLAWLLENNLQDSQTIIVMDVESSQSYEVNCGSDESLRPLGFFEADFVYGIAKKADIEVDVLGNLVFPMYKVGITNSTGDIEKEYESDGVYVLDVEMTDSMMTMFTATKQNGQFASGEEEHLRMSKSLDEGAVSISYLISERRQKQTILKFSHSLETKDTKLLSPKLVYFEEDRELHVEQEEAAENYYYVYGYGKLDNIYKNVNNAIVRANELVGVVVDEQMRYIWERGVLKSSIEIDESKIPSSVLKGITDLEKLDQNIDGTVVDLTGCTVEMVKYFVSSGRAVIGNWNGEIVVITGYDYFDNWIIYRPSSKTSGKEGEIDSEEAFEAGGNMFISYILNDN